MKKPRKTSVKSLSSGQRESRRREAARYFRTNKTAAWIAEEFGVSRISVQQWKRKWREEGSEGLVRSACGRRSKLTEHQEAVLRKDLLKGAKKFGYPTNRWTIKRVTAHVKRKMRVSYSERSIWHTLKRIGFPNKSTLGTRRT